MCAQIHNANASDVGFASNLTQWASIR